RCKPPSLSAAVADREPCDLSVRRRRRSWNWLRDAEMDPNADSSLQPPARGGYQNGYVRAAVHVDRRRPDGAAVRPCARSEDHEPEPGQRAQGRRTRDDL